jgi:hypothetical protein
MESQMPRLIDRDVQQAIRIRAERGMSAREIHEELSALPVFAGRVPTSRSIHRAVRAANPRSRQEWTLAEDDGDETAAVLAALAAVISESNGRRDYLTLDEARWLKKLAPVTPGLGAFVRYLLAREYARLSADEQSSKRLDHWVALQPWRFWSPDDGPNAPEDYGGEESYAAALSKGWVLASDFLDVELSKVALEENQGNESLPADVQRDGE